MRPRRPNLLPAAFFQKVHYSEDLPASAPVDLHAFGSNYRDLTQENVDPVIEKEIEKFMTKFRAEEETYVDQNLRENPIIWFSETSNAKSCRSSNSTNEQQTPNCTRCKMLAKIKKAKFKLRYKFMTTKLEHHAITLQSLRNFIASAEGKLRMRGRTDQDLQELRDALGIDRHRVENLTDINRQFFKSAEKAPE